MNEAEPSWFNWTAKVSYWPVAPILVAALSDRFRAVNGHRCGTATKGGASMATSTTFKANLPSPIH